MNETQLNRYKAQGMSPEEITSELGRIDRAIAQRGWTPGQKPDRHVHRYFKRRAVFAAELLRQITPQAA